MHSTRRTQPSVQSSLPSRLKKVLWLAPWWPVRPAGGLCEAVLSQACVLVHWAEGAVQVFPGGPDSRLGIPQAAAGCRVPCPHVQHRIIQPGALMTRRL